MCDNHGREYENQLLMEHRANKTKNYISSRFCVLVTEMKEENVKMDWSDYHRVWFWKSFKDELIFWAEEAQGIVWNLSVHALYGEGSIGKRNKRPFLLVQKELINLGQVTYVKLTFVELLLGVRHFSHIVLFKPYRNPTRKTADKHKWDFR